MTRSGLSGLASPGPADATHRRLVNLRDLAGVRLAGGGTVATGVLYRSDAPYAGDESPDSVPVWPPARVIDLRSPGEVAVGYSWPAGVDVHEIPLLRQAAVVGETAVPVPDPQPVLLPSLAEIYGYALDTVPDLLASLVGLAASAGGPVLVHCTAGKDRTGVAVAVLLLIGGAEPADVVSDYTATGPNLAALLARMRALGASLPAGVDAGSGLLASPAEAIGVVVDRLTGWPGGPQAWATEHGAPAGGIRRWQQRLAGAAG